MTIQYKFDENKIVNDVMDYINKTYESHYAQTKNYQATEIIIDQGHGTGFCMGNILKYAQRYGKKQGRNKDDLMKVIHYAIIQLSQDHYKSSNGLTSDTELKSVASEKFTKFKSVILDDLLNKQENITYTFNWNNT
tara:strand:+ start:341 stop:748 length:408 start_codon:yes stop_codon:yes gene_type:complete